MKATFRLPLALAAVLAAALLAAPAAHAFTFESANGVSADGSSNLTDPDAQFDSMNKDGSSMSLPGGVTMKFGSGPNSTSSFDSDYRSEMNHLFNPLGQPNN
jgi:hypothetical protein